MSYALIKNGVVINAIVWDGPAEDVGTLDFGNGIDAVEIPEGSSAGIGWLYSDGAFTSAPLSDEQQKEIDDEKKNNNIATKQSLMDDATRKIVVWQTKLLMGKKLSDEDTLSLNSWMDYIDSIDAIDPNVSNAISWPSLP